MKKKAIVNVRIIDPKNNIDQLGGILINELGQIEKSGPEISKENGDLKRFFCDIFIEGLKESSAFGKSHKQAETNAARVLIEKFIAIGKI